MMKKLVLVFFIFLVAFACSNADAKATVKLESMVCGMCSSTIENEISRLDGVVNIEIDEEKKIGVFTYKASVIDLSQIEQAIAKLGYSANDTEADLEAYEALASCCQIGSK
ncbi:MAG TPA: copper chaperone [Candidatus Marinimicrobia bacterium]|nr:copper chaperone [Candidatus Neomarinimicrobiota bacterium]HIO36099.1 copper chaperone [Candidatus Neomarinimicrobiota bacterium]